MQRLAQSKLASGLLEGRCVDHGGVLASLGVSESAKGASGKRSAKRTEVETFFLFRSAYVGSSPYLETRNLIKEFYIPHLLLSYNYILHASF